jgi:hypothetical protein
MIESHISQLAAVVPSADKGKILVQPKDLETINLVDIFHAGWYHLDQPSQGWKDESLPEKKSDPGRPVIPIAIGLHIFEEALCDYGASVNIMPKLIYEKIHGDPLLYTTMCLQLADQTLCYPKGIHEDVCVRVGQSYIPADFVVIETGGDMKAPIILGRPFLSTAKAIIYTESAKIYFNINGKKERFTFKNKTLQSPVHPQTLYIYENTTVKNNKNKKKSKQPPVETIKMINLVHMEYDHLLVSPYLNK